MNDSNPNDVTQDLQSRPPASASAAKHPEWIGRYRIERVLGQGGFGIVYLAQDEQLNRRVAVKVPHAALISRPEDAEMYLTEARTVANLDHPGIVPVHDVGSTEKCPCYVVSKYIPGTDLATRLKQKRLPYREAVELVATVADALHYAHKQGIVHRDVKPGNILMGKEGQPFVVDFGLALREENMGKGPEYAGTPAYMSPEQARGEGHRVDGRSDIFSLGIVFYELLAGRPPFRGETKAELREQVTSYDPRPLLQYDERIPKELQRICFKALSKRASERYSSAHELAQDLRLFLAHPTEIQCGSTPGGIAAADLETHASTSVTTPSSRLASSGTQPIKIVPKGLRSFDAHDADFFLELLPGPRDREGLPDSLRFWKTRIEETDADNTFNVGLIYGPSGCGKSSLVKAGLLPRLSEDVISVYIEATPGETETRLLHGLRKRCPALEDNLSLKATLAALRRGQGITVGKKVLIVLDQFEQWLHAKKEEEYSDLVQALRQCDGIRVQCIVMVRDDFWLAVSRFLRELEVRLLEGNNIALADLFDLDHARKVLAAFGQAFGKLPDKISETTKDQKEFIKQSVAGLAEEGKVICVRLALFAEMMKGKSWTPATLKEVGGTSGVGVTFLEETFSSPLASPDHRYHQKAARAVLKDLLPNSGTDIKGYMRSHAELLEASGYGNRPKDFNDLIRILDNEIRLITPTDPEGKDADDDSATHTHSGQKYFQLTHDYLVHSLRDWLTRKQKETRKGRAELKLFDTALTWNAKPENRFLPSWREFSSIRLLTNKKKWTEPQRKMMGKAGRVHATRIGLLATTIAILAVLGLAVRGQVEAQQKRSRVEGLVAQLITAEPAQVPEIVRQLNNVPELARELIAPLIESEAKTMDQQRSKLHAQLAIVRRDASLVDPLLEELLSNRVAYISPICELLKPHALALTERLHVMLRDPQIESKRRFRAGVARVALAGFIDLASTWEDQDLQFMATQLVMENAEYQPVLRQNLRPVSAQLLSPLEALFKDAQAADAMRLGAANAVADFAANQPELLTRLLADATPEQYEVLYSLVEKEKSDTGIAELKQIAAKLPPDDMGSVARIGYGQRRANAAVSLLRLGERETLLPVFDYTDDPEALTQFIFRCKPRGIGVELLLDLLVIVTEGRSTSSPSSTPAQSKTNASGYDQARARYALMLAIGEYGPSEIPSTRRDALVKQLLDWYANDPSSSVHGAAGWLLRQLGEHEIVTRVDKTPVPYSPDSEWFTLAITVTPTSPSKPEEKPVDENAAAEVKTTTVAPAKGATSQDAGTEQKDESDSTQPRKPEPPPEPLPPRTFYYTFIVFPPGETMIGSVGDEPDREKDETRHPVTLTRPFALLDREITFEELIAFSPAYADIPSDAGFGPHWYDSVSFCRWLSRQSGLSESDQSYADPESLNKEQYPRDPDPVANLFPRNWPLKLDRRGFRLPTESEWEVASRAGARTSYGYGSEASLLGRFGWSQENSGKHVHLPRELRPSIRGLFDLHGNLFEWTHDWYGDYGIEAITDPLGAQVGSYREGRGGWWDASAAHCRTACRDNDTPSYRSSYSGFRLALSSPSGVSSTADQGQAAQPSGVGTEGTSTEQRPAMP